MDSETHGACLSPHPREQMQLGARAALGDCTTSLRERLTGSPKDHSLTEHYVD